MNLLITYGSHLGSTAAIAEEIGDTIRRESTAEVTVRHARPGQTIDEFDAVILGGGTYGGRWHPDAVAFALEHARALSGRMVWFFSSGPLGDIASRGTPTPPAEIASLINLIHPREHATFAGSYDRSGVDE